MEFLCEYLFPQCDSDTNIIPICEQSCNEYLVTGICANHMHNVLITFNNATDYPNVSVNRLLQNNCSPPLDVKVSNNCTALTGIGLASISMFSIRYKHTFVYNI